MATPLQVPNAGLMRLIWSVGGVPYAVNVMGFTGTSSQPPTQALTNTIGAAVKSAVTSQGLVAQIHTSVALATVGIRNINVANQVELLDVGAAVPGTGTGSLLPPQTALCVTLRTNLAGKQYRGRVYIPGWATVADTTTGQATTAAQNAASNFVLACINALATSGYQAAIVSRPAPNANPPRPTGHTQPIIAQQVRDAIWDTQRRRAIPGI